MYDKGYLFRLLGMKQGNIEEKNVKNGIYISLIMIGIRRRKGL